MTDDDWVNMCSRYNPANEDAESFTTRLMEIVPSKGRTSGGTLKATSPPQRKKDLRNANRNERSQGHSLLPGHGTFSTSKIGGWRLVAVGGWRLAVGGGWQWLAVGGLRRLAAVDG